MLVLVKVQIVLCGEIVNLGVDGVQTVPQHQVGLSLADGLTGVAGGSVANRPLVHIPVSAGAEALELFDEVDQILRIVEIGGSLCGNGSQGEQADDKHQGHNYASDSSFHKLLAPLSVLMTTL